MSPHPARIAAVSSLILIIELALIRLIPAEVRAVAYFTNLVLMATFFGLGTGCILQRARSIEWLLPIGLVLIFSFVWVGRGIVIHDAAKDVHYWLMYLMKPTAYQSTKRTSARWRWHSQDLRSSKPIYFASVSANVTPRKN